MTGSAMALYPKPREIALEADEFPKEISWKSLQIFMKHRSFRRVFYFAGGASVFLAAWYLYNKLTARGQLGSGSSSASIPASESACIDLEACNNNGEKVLATGPPVEDKVVIHCCPRGFFVPSIATEPLKLETFLRVARIPYEVNFCNEYEAPFLTYGDKIGNDFRECIRVLSEKFDVNLDKDVTASRKTAANLVDISLENHFAWAILIWRWIYDDGKSMKKIHAMNALGQEVVPEVSQRVKEATRYHPIGQLDKAEFFKTIAQGIHDISAALGKHRYFQGQTPGTVDCHAFAIFAQILWNMPGSPFESQLRKYSNLVDFVKRMKEKFWPDWNELILKPKEFEEQYNITVRQHHRSPTSNNKTRRSSRSRDRESLGYTSAEDKNTTDGHGGSDEEGNLEKSAVPENAKVAMYAVSRAENVLPEADAVAVLAKKEGIPNEASQDSTNIELQQPVGILKPGATVNSLNANVVKPRSGFISASAGSTKFPVEQIQQPSVAALANNVDRVPPSPLSPQQPQQQQQQQAQQDSMTQVHKPSVKFANAASTESTMIHAQMPQPQQNEPNPNNGNFQAPSPPNLTQRPNAHYPGSLAELTRKRSPSVERQRQSEQMRHSMIQQQGQQYVNYAQQPPVTPQRQQMSPAGGVGVDDYRRAQSNTHAQYYHQAATPTSPANYGQPAYPMSAQMFNNQPMPGGVPSYPQQLHYAPSPMGHSDNDGLRSPPPFSHHHRLNPEQMQKAAQAHLDAHTAYYQHHQRHQQYHQNAQQQQQQQHFNNNYHSAAGIVPSFVAPPFDPRSPAAALLRF